MSKQMSRVNRFNFPKCPHCNKIGQQIETDMKTCDAPGCTVGLYWFGGFTQNIE